MTARRESRPKGRLAAPDWGSGALVGARGHGCKAPIKAGVVAGPERFEGARALARARGRRSRAPPAARQVGQAEPASYSYSLELAPRASARAGARWECTAEENRDSDTAGGS
jgi:hypothetical protein